MHGFLEGEGNGRVVDILGGQAKMDKFLVGFQSEEVELLFDIIFHGLYVVVGGPFDRFYLQGTVHIKPGVDGTEVFKAGTVE